MNYCTNCGNKVDSNAFICTHCGVKLNNEVNNQVVDKGGFGWGVLGFFVPVAGLILYLVWKNERPKTALSAGKGALAYLIFYIVMLLIVFTLGFISAFTEVKTSSYNDEYYYNFE